jgi:hypothetical protein
MGKKQTRRSISVAGHTYARLRAHCDEAGKSMSEIVEGLLAPILGGTVEHPVESAPLEVTPPAEIPIRHARRVRNWNGGVVRARPDAPKPLALPEGQNDPERSGRNALSTGRLEKRAPIGNVRTF